MMVMVGCSTKAPTLSNSRGRQVGRQVGRYVTVVRCPWRSLCVPLAWLDTSTACLAGALHWLRHVTAFTLQTPASSPARSAV